jgi:hypothetical protein
MVGITTVTMYRALAEPPMEYSGCISGAELPFMDRCGKKSLIIGTAIAAFCRDEERASLAFE